MSDIALFEIVCLCILFVAGIGLVAWDFRDARRERRERVEHPHAVWSSREFRGPRKPAA